MVRLSQPHSRSLGFLSGVLVSFMSLLAPAGAEPEMRVHFIDVGQGDSMLVEFPCGAVLVDTGGQDAAATEQLIDYLTEFFKRRADLENTLDSVITTHNHIDHTRGLQEVVETFTVERYVDNGRVEVLKGKPGTKNPLWLHENASTGGRNITIREAPDSEVVEVEDLSGLTDDLIDPVNCSECDPKIVILSGGHTGNPGWEDKEFENENNHSLVVRIDFGEASLLTTGDLELAGIETLVDYYAETDSLDTDILHVGHHGSYNATTEDFLQAVTPEIAVFSAGKWYFGRNTGERFSTFAYGHPRLVTIALLADNIERLREAPIHARAADGAKRFKRMDVEKAIYGTSWDGDVVVTALPNGNLSVLTATGSN
ncbi:MAG: hypothetical protein GHCLOJNM_00211 [bacterium]|nr:hypothetical protein [bacterium]